MTMCTSLLSDIDAAAGGKYVVIKTRAIICHAPTGICYLFFTCPVHRMFNAVIILMLDFQVKQCKKVTNWNPEGK